MERIRGDLLNFLPDLLKTTERTQYGTVVRLLRRITQTIPTNLPADKLLREYFLPLLNAYDETSAEHCEQVAERVLILAKLFAQAYPARALNNNELNDLRFGALGHDIGKCGVPQSTLKSPTKLTGQQWDIMHLHPVYSNELLRPFPSLNNARQIALLHHERPDGNGYPNGFDNLILPHVLAAQMLTMADVWDAFISPRPYKSPLTIEDVGIEFQNHSGTHYCPELVDVFVKNFPAVSSPTSLHSPVQVLPVARK